MAEINGTETHYLARFNARRNDDLVPQEELADLKKAMEASLSTAFLNALKLLPEGITHFTGSVSILSVGFEEEQQQQTSTEQQPQAAASSAPDPEAASVGVNMTNAEQRFIRLHGWDPKWQHRHRGNPFKNCRECHMPYSANQHTKIVSGDKWPITMDDELSAEEELE